MFALRSVDIPPVMKLDGPGRALPQAVLRQLYENLSALDASTSTRHARPAIELLMDTGRRPEEILRLRYDCLDTAADGKHVLVYAEFKINREGRRLPITDTTANLIRGQQQAVRALYPDTPVGELALLPGKAAQSAWHPEPDPEQPQHSAPWVGGRVTAAAVGRWDRVRQGRRGPVRLPAQLRTAPR
jgi:integrase